MARLPATSAFAALGLALLVPAALVPGLGPAAAETRAFRADYTVTLLGLPVARARFDSTFSGGRFRIEGSLSSTGLARIFDDTEGTTSVEGVIEGDGVRPAAFDADYVSGRKKGRTAIRFAGGDVESVVNQPQKTRDPRSWVAVSQAHLKAALDPLSSALVVAKRPEEVCGRTIRFFDGELRADLKLAPVRGADSKLDGARVTCTASFVPVAGYRKGRKQIEYLKDRSRIAVTFAPLSGTGLYTPVDASVGTRIGTLRILATRIEAR